jgi:epoxyqueuosine reductase
MTQGTFDCQDVRRSRMNNLKDEIKAFALSKGADLVGIAPASRFDGAPDGHKPEDILADAKTVIACAKRIPNAVVANGPATSYHVTMDIVDDQLDWIAYEIAIFVEQQGGSAVPVTADGPYYDWDAENLCGRGDMSHKHAAQAAGLGKLGRNSLLITPEFGNRVQLVSVVTNLDVEPDPLIGKELCPSECNLCIEACPVQAIVDEGQVIQKTCRSFMFEELPRGTVIESCRECRKVCPVGVK